MDPMKWLESLAARQGAKAEELTTAADLDIPIPVDAKETGPGYTPGYDTGSKKAAPAPQPVKAPEPPKAATPPPPPPTPTPIPTPAGIETPAGELDWLTSLSAESVSADASGEDVLGGVDPMKWLESLAARQGANPDELTTEADLNIPVPENASDTGPGYFDFDPFSSTQGREAATPEPVAASSEPTPVAASDDLLGGLDPLAWLEQLALNQGGNPAEMVTTPESQARPVQSQPPAAQPPVQPQVVQPPVEPPMSEAEAVEALGIGATTDGAEDVDPLAWLENLSATPGQDMFSTSIDFSAFEATAEPVEETMAPNAALSWLEQLTADESNLPATEPEPAPVDRNAGPLSNDINEVQRWLEEQARGLEMTRQKLEAEEIEELPPAEAASEIPEWLRAVAPGMNAPAPVGEQVAPPALNPNDLPPWLAESAMDDEQAIREFDSFFVESEPEPAAARAETLLSPDEIAALTGPQSEEEVDSLAEALNEEYDRRVAGDETVPDWYLEAVSRVEEAPIAIPAQASEAPAEYEWLGTLETSEAEPAVAGDIPAWLRDMATGLSDTTSAPVNESASVDNWLTESDESEAEAADLPEWLRSMSPEPPAAPPVQPQVVEPPKPAQPVAAAPQPVPTPPVPQPTPQPAPQPTVQPIAQPVAQPAAATVQPPKATPAPAPQPAGNHHERLRRARELVSAGQDTASLEHYQSLVDNAQLLEETRADLRGLVEKNPKEPRLRRLLGDTHMRLGDLQAALDTYRSALDQL
jgi:outer membrane biosynthesis protein TonB